MSSSKKKRLRVGKYLILSPGLFFLVAAYFLPIFLMISLSFFRSQPGSGLIDYTFNLENFVRLADPYYFKILIRTFLIALATTALSLILGYPVAYLMVKCKPRYKNIILAIILTPLLTNVVARTLGLMIIFGNNGPVNQLIALMGLPKVAFIPGYPGIVLGLTQVFIPYMILSIKSVLENINFNLEDAAKDLGCGKIQSFRKVIFPLSTPGIVAGSIFVFLLSFSSFVTPRLLGGGKIMVITVLIFQQAMTILNWPFAAAIDALLLCFSLTLVICFNRITGRVEKMGDRSGIYREINYETAFRRGIRKLKNKWYDFRCGLITRKERPLTGDIRKGFRMSGFLLLALQILTLIFIILPLPVVILSSFSESSRITFPPKAFSLKWYEGLFVRTEYIRSFLLSIRLALITVAISLVLGTIVALALSRYKFRGGEVLKTIFLSPLMLPGVIVGLALLRAFAMIGWVATFRGLVVAHILMSSAYVVRMVLSSLVGFDISVEEAARDLGASPFYTFLKITLPIIKPGIFVAALFAFIVSLDETSLSVFLAGGSTITLPVRIFSMLEHGVEPTVTAVSSLLIVLSLGALFLINKFIGLEKFKL
jgi:putative spermidine/putrescine transport system permease protein